jgi:hypothetical protein
MIHIHPWRRMPGVHSFEEFSEQLFLGIGWRPFRLVRFLRLLRPSAGATSKHKDVVARAHPPLFSRCCLRDHGIYVSHVGDGCQGAAISTRLAAAHKLGSVWRRTGTRHGHPLSQVNLAGAAGLKRGGVTKLFKGLLVGIVLFAGDVLGARKCGWPV